MAFTEEGKAISKNQFSRSAEQVNMRKSSGIHNFKNLNKAHSFTQIFRTGSKFLCDQLHLINQSSLFLETRQQDKRTTDSICWPDQG